MTESTASSPVFKFCETWRESFLEVLGQLGLASPVATMTPATPLDSIPPAEIESSNPARFSCTQSLQGDLLWLAPTPAALQIAQLLMSEPLDPAAEFSETHRDAFAEFMRQIAGPTATAWKQEYGSPVDFNFETSPTTSFAPAQQTTLQLSGTNFPELTLRFLLSAPLCDSLVATVVTPIPSATASTFAAPPADVQPVSHSALPPNLNLLLDVELQATIRFGEREMLLRDIFGLMPGAVVELNQLVNEPADLLVAGILVARGEVVVVDGNFGLRVTEVVSEQERAEILRM